MATKTIPAKIYWKQNLSGGINSATDDALIENNESPLLKNISLDRVGNWANRRGTALTGDVTAGSNRIWGLGTYNKSDGTHTMFRVCDADLEKYNGSTTWTEVDTDEWTANKKVNMINFLDRLYLGCEDGTTPLAYTTTTTITDIVPTIGGHHLATVKDTLAVGGNSIKPNVIFVSKPFTDTFHSATGTCSANADSNGANTVVTTASVFESDIIPAILYNSTEGAMRTIKEWHNATVPYVTTDSSTSTWDNDTVYVMYKAFLQDGPVTGIVGFQGNFVSFDDDNMYIWDPTSTTSSKLPGFGCVNERTIQVVDGTLIWVNRNGIYLWTGGEDRPIEISGKLKDDVNGYGIWNLINDTWTQMASGTLEGKYYLSVGDLSTQSGAPASAITNAEFVFDINKGSWVLNSRDDEPMVYTVFTNSSGQKDLYYGEKTAQAVYKINTGTTDDDSADAASAISVEARTPHYTFPDPTIEYRIVSYYVKYKSGGDVTVTSSVNGGAYSTVDTLSSSSTTTTVKILPPTEKDGFTHSLKFTCSSTMEIEAIGFEAIPVSFGSVAT